MFVFYALAISLAIAYMAVMGAYFFWWKKSKAIGAELLRNAPSKSFVSVLVPARNEAANIEACLRSIFENDFDKNRFEIIAIDDRSEDQTAQLIENQGFSNLRLFRMTDQSSPFEPTAAHKKKALETGISAARGSLILTTDADCLVPKDWIGLAAAFFETEPRAQMLAGPVLFFDEKNGFERFQSLDFAGLMAITAAGIEGRFQRTANGANLAFRKTAFEAVGGYRGIDHLASGDDMLLMQKIAQRWPDGIFFMKNATATVRTRAKPDWPSFFWQRLRWSSKSGELPERQVTVILAVVYFFCCSLIVLTSMALVFCEKAAAVLVFCLAAKALADWLFLRSATAFFGRSDLMRSFWPSFFRHIGYVAAVGTASFFVKKYEWKGRRVR